MSQKDNDVEWANKVMQGTPQPAAAGNRMLYFAVIAVAVVTAIALFVYMYPGDGKTTPPVPPQQPVLPAIQNPTYVTPQGVLVQAPTAAPLTAAK